MCVCVYIFQYTGSKVISVDWSKLAKANFADIDNFWPPALYKKALVNTQIVGAEIASLMEALVIQQSAAYSNMWCIGHSLGAHICGFAGRRTNGSLGRITGENNIFNIVWPCNRNKYHTVLQ